jgi:hypothetical protein
MDLSSIGFIGIMVILIVGCMFVISAVVSNEYFPSIVIKIIGIIGIIVAISSLVLFAIGMRTNRIEYKEVEITNYKDFGNAIVLQIDNNEVIIKTEVEWRSPKIVYKKIKINNFGDKTYEYVLKKEE